MGRARDAYILVLLRRAFDRPPEVASREVLVVERFKDAKQLADGDAPLLLRLVEDVLRIAVPEDLVHDPDQLVVALHSPRVRGERVIFGQLRTPDHVGEGEPELLLEAHADPSIPRG